MSYTDFCSACISGDLEKVKSLVEAGVDPTKWYHRGIRCASRTGHLEIVKYFTSIGVDIRVLDDTPVSIAVENGKLDVVKYLVDKGADITNGDGYLIRRTKEYDYFEELEYIKVLILSEMKRRALFSLLNKKGLINRDLMSLVHFRYTNYYRMCQEV